eukprot:scaffold1557_cov108-Isochrysis_galbana.AAC.9
MKQTGARHTAPTVLTTPKHERSGGPTSLTLPSTSIQPKRTSTQFDRPTSRRTGAWHFATGTPPPDTLDLGIWRRCGQDWNRIGSW